MTLEEERARKEAREEERVQMQVLNDHIVANIKLELTPDVT